MRENAWDIIEKWRLANSIDGIQSAVIFRHRNDTVMLHIVRYLSQGVSGSHVGCESVKQAKILFSRRFKSKEEKVRWELDT